MYQYAATRNAAFASAEPAHRWTFNARRRVNGGLAVVGETLYADTFGGDVLAIDRRSGRVLWHAHVPRTSMTAPIVADGLVVVGTGTNDVLTKTGSKLVWGVPGGDEIAAFDAGTGRPRWTFKTVGEDMPSPALVHVNGRDVLVFANGDDHVRALDVQTGRLLWSKGVDGVATMASAAVLGDTVYVLAGPSAAMHRPDHVYAVRASDGAFRWTAPYGNADSSPAAGNGDVYVQDAQIVTGPPTANAMNDVYAIDAMTGHLRWARNSAVGFFTGIGTNEQAIASMLDRGTLFESLPAARRFVAYEATQGRVLWSIATDAAVKMSAVAMNGRLYVGDTAGVLYTIDEGDGRVLSRRRFGAPFSCSPPVLVGSTLYVADDTTIYALPIQ